MRILFFKALPSAGSDEDKLPPDEKMLGILKDNVRLAKTEEARKRAQRELDEFVAGKRKLVNGSGNANNLS